MTEMINNKITHNKKRNVGLIYEFFARYMSKAILEGRQADVEKAKLLIRKHFNKTTDLHRELQLFKTLKESKTNSREAAVHLLNRVRDVVRNQSQTRLDVEKTCLIHEINQTLCQPEFFNQNITEYKLFGAIQILLNSWRNVDFLSENVGTVVQFEEIVLEHLTTKKPKEKPAVACDPDEELSSVNRLVVDIMTDKVNKKFDNLSEEQKKIINLYVFQEENIEIKKELVNILENMKQRMLNSILNENGSQMRSGDLGGKLTEIKTLLDTQYSDTTALSDELVTFYLGISKLEKEFC